MSKHNNYTYFSKLLDGSFIHVLSYTCEAASGESEARAASAASGEREARAASAANRKREARAASASSREREAHVYFNYELLDDILPLCSKLLDDILTRWFVHIRAITHHIDYNHLNQRI